MKKLLSEKTRPLVNFQELTVSDTQSGTSLHWVDPVARQRSGAFKFSDHG